MFGGIVDLFLALALAAQVWVGQIGALLPDMGELLKCPDEQSVCAPEVVDRSIENTF